MNFVILSYIYSFVFISIVSNFSTSSSLHFILVNCQSNIRNYRKFLKWSFNIFILLYLSFILNNKNYSKYTIFTFGYQQHQMSDQKGVDLGTCFTRAKKSEMRGRDISYSSASFLNSQ